MSVQEEAQALLKAATDAPWAGETFHTPDAPASNCCTVWSPEKSMDGVVLIIAYTGDGPTSEANMELIAWAPELIQRMATKLDQMEQLVQAPMSDPSELWMDGWWTAMNRIRHILEED